MCDAWYICAHNGLACKSTTFLRNKQIFAQKNIIFLQFYAKCGFWKKKTNKTPTLNVALRAWCISRLIIYKSKLFYLLNRLIHTLRVTFNVGKNLQNLFFSLQSAMLRRVFLCFCFWMIEHDVWWVLMIKSIREFIYEDFLTAIDTRSKAQYHSKVFYMFFS